MSVVLPDPGSSLADLRGVATVGEGYIPRYPVTIVIGSGGIAPFLQTIGGCWRRRIAKSSGSAPPKAEPRALLLGRSAQM